MDPLPPEPLSAGTLLRNPEPLITQYRQILGVPPIQGSQARSKADGTIALGEMDGKLYFGVNSSSPGYTTTDEKMATAMRDVMIEAYPEIMSTTNRGWKPNDALYHAEATMLLRAATKNGGKLTGKTITIRVDRNLCGSCEIVLPALSEKLGNPRIEIIGPNGGKWILVNGKWIETAR